MLQRATFTLAIALFFLASLPSLAQDPGADTFKAQCAVCHGDDGLGNTAVGKALGVRSYKAPDVLKLSNAQLTAIIKNGKNNMPPFTGKLTDAQIKDLLVHIHKLQK